MTNALESDIAIIGGGLVGYTVALAFAQAGFRVNLFEAQKPDVSQLMQTEGRAISLAYTSCLLYRSLGLWDKLLEKACPIKEVAVSEKGSFGKCLIQASSLKLTALGYVIPATHLVAVLWEAISQHENIHLIAPFTVEEIEQNGDQATLNETYTSRLVIACDGTESFTREYFHIPISQKNYEQTAVVANLSVHPSPHGCAIQRFTQTGILALLPLGQDMMTSALTVRTDKLAELSLDQPEKYLALVQNLLGSRHLRVSQLGKVYTYPLRWTQALNVVQGRTVLLGNAAHTISPVAAQGLNLALRDLAMLYDIIQACPQDLGSRASLEKYAQQSSQAQQTVISFTDRLTDWVMPRSLQPFRSLGLFALDHCSPIKNKLAQALTGLSPHGGSLMRAGESEL